MLILFDVDATLITTLGVGMRALEVGGKALHGPAFSMAGVEVAGRLDPLIIGDLLTANGVPNNDHEMGRMREGYKSNLILELAKPGVAKQLPGVPELLTALRTEGNATMGLLTGNWPDTGSLKLRAAGIEPDDFPVRVWADDCPVLPHSRDQLPGVALGRYRELHGVDLPGDRAIIIGDTPHDIACARAHGCRVIGVATGRFTTKDLAHADLAVEDLSDTQMLMEWLNG